MPEERTNARSAREFLSRAINEMLINNCYVRWPVLVPMADTRRAIPAVRKIRLDDTASQRAKRSWFLAVSQVEVSFSGHVHACQPNEVTLERSQPRDFCGTFCSRYAVIAIGRLTNQRSERIAVAILHAVLLAFLLAFLARVSSFYWIGHPEEG